METSTEIADLAQACRFAVKATVGVELDGTQDTLPLLDHYVQLADSPTDQIIALVAPMCGAYFGEVIRYELGDGQWVTPPGEHAQWQLKMQRCALHFNPVGIAVEVLTGKDPEGWSAHLQTDGAGRAVLREALERLGDVREDDYYSFGVRYEGIEQAYRALYQGKFRLSQP